MSNKGTITKNLLAEMSYIVRQEYSIKAKAAGTSEKN